MHFIEVTVSLITDQINMWKFSLYLQLKDTDMYFKVVNCSIIRLTMKTVNDRIKLSLFFNS